MFTEPRTTFLLQSVKISLPRDIFMTFQLLSVFYNLYKAPRVPLQYYQYGFIYSIIDPPTTFLIKQILNNSVQKTWLWWSSLSHIVIQFWWRYYTQNFKWSDQLPHYENLFKFLFTSKMVIWGYGRLGGELGRGRGRVGRVGTSSEPSQHLQSHLNKIKLFVKGCVIDALP